MRCRSSRGLRESREVTVANSIGRQPKDRVLREEVEPRSGGRKLSYKSAAASRLNFFSVVFLGLTPEAIRCRHFAIEDDSNV